MIETMLSMPHKKNAGKDQLVFIQQLQLTLAELI